MFNIRNPWNVFPNVIHTDDAVQLLLGDIQGQLTFPAQINLKSSPCSDSLLDVCTTKRQWGKKTGLDPSLFQKKQNLRLRFGFNGSWHLNSTWCFCNPHIFKCSSACFSARNAVQPEEFWPIFVTLHSLSLPFQPLWLALVTLEGSLPFYCFFFKCILNKRLLQRAEPPVIWHFEGRTVFKTKRCYFHFKNYYNSANIFSQISYLHDLCVAGRV